MTAVTTALVAMTPESSKPSCEDARMMPMKATSVVMRSGTMRGSDGRNQRTNPSNTTMPPSSTVASVLV